MASPRGVRRGLVLLALVTLLAAGDASSASETVTLIRYPGVTGESTLQGYAGWVRLTHGNFMLDREPAPGAADAIRDSGGTLMLTREGLTGDTPDAFTRALYGVQAEGGVLDLELAYVISSDTAPPREFGAWSLRDCALASLMLDLGPPATETASFHCRRAVARVGDAGSAE